jgi:hypothetical protein
MGIISIAVKKMKRFGRRDGGTAEKCNWEEEDQFEGPHDRVESKNSWLWQILLAR